jgi:NAD(P)-dependent dehydrogenase (short-subunit alcohol dehydrogenase family)
MKNLFSLEGRVAVVTGGAGQLGGENARGLAACGAKVAIFDVAESVDAVGVSSFVVDVTDRDAIERATANLPDVPHVLVNAAALDSPRCARRGGGAVRGLSVRRSTVMQVNVKGRFSPARWSARVASRPWLDRELVTRSTGMLSPVRKSQLGAGTAGRSSTGRILGFEVRALQPHALSRHLLGKSGVRVNTLTLAGVSDEQPQVPGHYTARMPLGRMARPAGRRAVVLSPRLRLLT